jgi:hypothetical protein
MGLTKAQLEALNITSFPDNTTGLITPAILRGYNTASIENTVNQDVYTTDSASVKTSINALNAATSSYATSAITASSLITASFDNGTRNLTFTKGNNTQFSVNIPDVSGSTGNFATTGSNSFNGNQTISGSLLLNGTEVNMTSSVMRFTTTGTGSITFVPGGSVRFQGNTDFTNPVRVPIINVDNLAGGGYYGFNAEVDGRIYQDFSGSVNTRINNIVAGTGFATTGSNTFRGTQTISGSVSVSGSVRQTINAPANGTQTDFIVVKNATPSGKPYSYQNFNLQNLPAFGPDYEDAFILEAYDSSGYNYGSELTLNGLGLTATITPSGSVFGVNPGILRIKDTENQKSIAVLDASVVELGAGVSTTDSVKIGKSTLPYLQLSSLSNQITGSTTISGSNGLRLIGNQTITGSLILSSSANVELEVLGNAVITGSLSISGSSEFDLTIQGRGLITGPNAGVTPQLLISGSDFNNRVGRSSMQICSPNRTFGTGAGSNSLLAQTGLNTSAQLFVAVFDEPDFVTDIEFAINVDTGSGIQFQDIRNDNYVYTTWLKIAPNTGTNPPLEFKRAMQVTGSLSIQSGSAFFANGNRQFNVGTFQSNVSQSGSANVSQSIQLEVTDISQGVSIVSGSRITVANSGTYNIQFSAQVDRSSGTGADQIYIWLKKNGNNVADTAGAITVEGNTAAAKTIAAWNYVVNAAANDYYELCWQSADANIVITRLAASGNIPSVPSVILTVTQVR